MAAEEVHRIKVDYKARIANALGSDKNRTTITARCSCGWEFNKDRRSLVVTGHEQLHSAIQVHKLGVALQALGIHFSIEST